MRQLSGYWRNYNRIFFFISCSLLAISSRAQNINTQLTELSFDKFALERDTLIKDSTLNTVNESNWKILYYHIYQSTKGTQVKSGVINIFKDSLNSYCQSNNTVQGDIFSNENETLRKNNVVQFILAIKDGDRKWINNLGLLKGFYSQYVIVNNKPFYPHNNLKYLEVIDKSGSSFGFIKYGTKNLQLKNISTSQMETLNELMSFVY